MKKPAIIIGFIFVISAIIFTYEAYFHSSYIILAEKENLSADSREYLYKCLNENKIKYREDERGSVLIQEKDHKKAIFSCA